MKSAVLSRVSILSGVRETDSRETITANEACFELTDGDAEISRNLENLETRSLLVTVDLMP